MKKLVSTLILTCMFAPTAFSQQQQRISCMVGSGNQAKIRDDIHVKYFNEQIEKKYNTNELTLIEARLVSDNKDVLIKYEGVESKLRSLGDGAVIYTLGTVIGVLTGVTSCLYEEYRRSDYERVNLYEVEYKKLNGTTCKQLTTIHSIIDGDEWYGRPVVKYHEVSCEN